MLKELILAVLFAAIGMTVDHFGLIEHHAYWAAYGYVWGLATAYIFHLDGDNHSGEAGHD